MRAGFGFVPILLVPTFAVLLGTTLAQEFYCEGVDDDADFEIDEGCPRTCDRPYLETGPRTVAPGSTGATAVSLVRPGTGLAWAYADTRSGSSQVYVQITATSGAPDRPEVRISDGTNPASNPKVLLRSPSTYAVVWVDERTGNPDIWFRVLDESGAPAPGTVDTNISSNNSFSLNPSAAWSGNGFAVVWDDTKGSNRDIYFQRLDVLGSPVGNSVRVTSVTTLQEQASIAWDGTQYAVSWTDERDGNREIYAQRIDGTGNLLGSAVRLTDAAGDSHRSVIVTISAARFGVAWEDSQSGSPAVWYAVWEGPSWSATGGAAISESSGSATAPALTTTGSEMFLAWRDTRHGGGDVYVRRLSSSGSSLSGELRLTTDGLAGSSVSAAWHGSGFGVAHLGGDGPRLTLGGCGGTDLDGDGYFLDTGDCNDHSTAQSPSVPETCDALDNECDGVADEGCPGTCNVRVAGESVDVRIPVETGGSPRAVSGAGGYGVSWDEEETYPGCCLVDAPYFRTLDEDGIPASPAIRIVPPELSGGATWVAWNGVEYAVVWANFDRTEFVPRIAFRRFAPDGTPLGPHREVTTDPILPYGHRRPVLVWGGNEYALTFMDFEQSGGSRANRFLRLDREGRPLERPRDISPVPSELAHLAFDGIGYGLSYLSRVDPHFRKLDRFGGFASDAVAIRSDLFDQGFNRVATSPWGYGVTWAEDTGPPEVAGDIFYQRFDRDGGAVGGPTKITTWSTGPLNTSEHHLVFTGSEFLLIGKEFANAAQIVLTRFDEWGELRQIDPLVVFSTSSGLPIGDPWLTWNGVEPLALWVDSEEGGVGHARPRSRRLLCCETTPVPSSVTGVSWLDPTTLTWTTSGVPTYDRVRGDLGDVRSTGSFQSSPIDCKRDLTTTTQEPEMPAVETPFYYLLRGVGVCGPGTWNGPAPPQQGDRDADLMGHPNACP